MEVNGAEAKAKKGPTDKAWWYKLPKQLPKKISTLVSVIAKEAAIRPLIRH